MKNYLVIDGKQVELSEETNENIKAGLSEKKPFERIIGNVRISRQCNTRCAYPIKISIFNGVKYGSGKGQFNNEGACIPGDTLTIENARCIATALLELVHEIEGEE